MSSQTREVQLRRQELWPTTIWSIFLSDMETLNTIMRADIDAMWAQSEGAEGRSNPLGWQSGKQLQDQVAFQQVLGMAMNAVANPLASWHNWDLSVGTLKIESWANVNPPGSMNRIHTHDRALFSGVYYIHVPPDSGDLLFYNGRRLFRSDEFPPLRDPSRRDLNGLVEAVVPQPGQLVIFPGWLPHEVELNNSKDTRYSISFNIGLHR